MDSINIDINMDFTNINNKETKTETNTNNKKDKSINKEIILCEGFKKNKTNCTKKSTGIFENKYYCNVHLKQYLLEANKKKNEVNEVNEINEVNEVNEVNDKNDKNEYKDKNEGNDICGGIKKDGDRCNKKGIELVEKRCYCKVHYNQIQKETLKKQLNEDKKIMKDFNKFITSKIKGNYSDTEFKIIKDTYKKYMLIFHPDKCKMKNIDSIEISKSLNLYMDNVKLVYE